MKVFLDFDDTLFNMKRFKRDFINVFLRNGVKRKEFEDSYYSYKNKKTKEGKYYSLKKQIRALSRQSLIDDKKLALELDEFLKDLKKYVFPDVDEFLGSFLKKDLFLMTYGQVAFQRKKIRNSGLRDRFGHILITREDKIEKIAEFSKKLGFEKDEKIVLIDDRPDQLEGARKCRRSIITFRVCRPEGRYSDLVCSEKDYEVKNLKEAGKIINKIK